MPDKKKNTLSHFIKRGPSTFPKAQKGKHNKNTETSTDETDRTKTFQSK